MVKQQRFDRFLNIFNAVCFVLLVLAFYVVSKLIVAPGFTRELLVMLEVIFLMFVLPAFIFSFIRAAKFEQEFSIKVLLKALVSTVVFSVLLFLFMELSEYVLELLITKFFASVARYYTSYGFIFYGYNIFLIYFVVIIKD